MTTSDSIRLTGVRAFGHHGVLESERRDGQEFVVDVEAWLDTRRAAAFDDLTQTCDYGSLAERLVAVISGQPVNLIETLAERLAAVALADAVIREVEVTVHKPSAPITVPFGDVTVRIRRSHVNVPVVTGDAQGGSGLREELLDQAPARPAEVVLALGANLGDVVGTLRAAIHELDAMAEVSVNVVGPLARTASVGGPEQPDFHNTVVLATTTLSPHALLDAVHQVEAAHGRERTVVWGPRTLDIDIITYDQVVAFSDRLEIPHPRAHERAFVLLPWAQIDAQAELPGLGGGPVGVLAETAADRSGVRALALDWFAADVPAVAEHDAGAGPTPPGLP